MGTEIATDRLKAAGIVNYASLLSPQDRSEFLAWIGVRIEALLEPYWDKRPSDLVKAEILMDWMDGLKAFTPDEIRMGCREYLNGPDRARKPKPGDISNLIGADRRRRLALIKQPEIHAPIRATPEEIAHRKRVAAEVLAKFSEKDA